MPAPPTGMSIQSVTDSLKPLGCTHVIDFPAQRAKNNFLINKVWAVVRDGSVQQVFIHHAERRTMDKY